MCINCLTKAAPNLRKINISLPEIKAMLKLDLIVPRFSIWCSN